MVKEWILYGQKCDLVKYLRGGIYPGFSGWTLNPMASVPLRVRQRGIWQTVVEAVWPQRQRLDRRGHKGRNAHSCQQPEEAKDGFSPRASGGGAAALSAFWPPEQREYISVVLSHQLRGGCHSSYRKSVFWIWWPGKQCWARGLPLSWSVTWPKGR